MENVAEHMNTDERVMEYYFFFIEKHCWYNV
jgi:hypothetical protein